MNKATFTEDQVEAAKAIAKADVKVWHAASVIGPVLAEIPADDQTALTAFWKSLAGEMSYRPHAEYWGTHNTGGRKMVSFWAAFYRAAKDHGFDPALAFSGGTVPTMASVKAFTTGRDSLDIGKLTASLTGKGARPFCLATVKDALAIVKRGPKTKTKADKATKAATKAITDEARAEAKAIVAEAHNDQKAVTLGRIVSFIAKQADPEMLAPIDAAVKQAKARIAAAEAI